jgi:hypothetical protein
MHDFVCHNPAQDVLEQPGMRSERKGPIIKDEGAALISGPRRHADGRAGRAWQRVLHDSYGKIAGRFGRGTGSRSRAGEPIQFDGYFAQQPGRLNLGRGPD